MMYCQVKYFNKVYVGKVLLEIEKGWHIWQITFPGYPTLRPSSYLGRNVPKAKRPIGSAAADAVLYEATIRKLQSRFEARMPKSWKKYMFI